MYNAYNTHIYMYMCVCVCVCVYIYIYLGCFHILVIINNAIMNIGIHISFLISIFVLFG